MRPIRKFEVLAASNPFVYCITFTLTFYLFVALFSSFSLVEGYFDYDEYLNMTLGNFENVTEPFASRIFGPLLAHWLMRFAHISPTSALSVVCGVGWALVPIAAGYLLFLCSVPVRWSLIIATVPFPAVDARYYLVPDAWAALSVILFMIAVKIDKHACAFVASCAAMFVRSSSAAAIIIWSAAASPDSRFRWVRISICGVGFGLVLKYFAFQTHSSNVHHMNQALYYLAKVPVNLLHNLVGIQFYSDSINWCSPPIFAFDVSKIPGMGRIHMLGVCTPDFGNLARALVCYFFIFGALPIWLLISEAPRDRWTRARLKGDLTPLVFLVFFALAPGFGRTVVRLFIEAYPLLLLAVVRASNSGYPDRLAPMLFFLVYNLVGMAIIAFILPLEP